MVTRRILSLPFLFMLTASAPSMPTLDLNKGVELINAAPSDWRAGLVVLFLLLIVQTIERYWLGFRTSKTFEKYH